MSSNCRKCISCGHEVSQYASKCSNCGAAVEFKRHAFVTSWLWFCVVINGLCAVGYFALLFSSKGLWTRTPEPIWLRLIWLFGSVVTLYGYIMLLKWKRLGFYLCMGMSILSAVVSLIVSGSFTALSAIIGILVLYSILQIKRDGVEYWEAMDLKES